MCVKLHLYYLTFLPFDPFRERFSQMRFSWKDLKQMDPGLGVVNRGADLTHLGAMDLGAKGV
jgi:hypothetical protein